jgi:hypothetical protein
MCAASVGGAFAIAGSLVGLVSQIVHGRPVSNLAGLTLFFVFGAGVVALSRPRDVRALTVATVLVAVSIVTELLGRLGLLYLPALVLFVVGIGRTEGEPEERAAEPAATVGRPVARPRPRPVAARAGEARPTLAAKWDRRIRQARQAPPVEQPASAEALRRAG